jgi:hypothetical protein
MKFFNRLIAAISDQNDYKAATLPSVSYPTGPVFLRELLPQSLTLFGDSAHFSTWMRAVWGSAGKLPGRIVSGAGAALLVGEAAYDATTMIRCAVIE